MSDKPFWSDMHNELDAAGNPTALAKALNLVMDHGCQCCDEEGNDLDECEGTCWPAVAEAALKSLWDQVQEQPVDIAIAREARETLLSGLECKHDSLKARLKSDPSRFYKGHIDTWFKRVSRARKWLERLKEGNGNE